MIKGMLNQTDLSTLKRIFLTKDEFNKFARQVVSRHEFYTVLNEVDQRFNKLEQKLDSKFDQVMTMLDSVIHELQASREEQTILTYRLSEHTEQIANCEQRLAKLEAKIAFPEWWVFCGPKGGRTPDLLHAMQAL